MSEHRIVVCRADALGEDETVKFVFGGGAVVEGAGGRPVTRPPSEGFVVRHKGELHAYRNECRHIPMTMDWVENRFLSRDRCWIQCATHGALYEIATGLCVAGPPEGKTLHRLPVSIEDGEVVVRVRA